MGNKQLEIIHIPHGNGQPYYHQPSERIPRMPRLGQAVICGAEVNPMDGAESMDLEWIVDGQGAVQRVSCVCIGDSDSVGNSGTHRSWQGCIPPTQQAGTISYRFTARTGHETIHSAWYSYSTEPVIVLEELESWRFLPDGRLELMIRNSSGGLSQAVFALTEWGLTTGITIFPGEVSPGSDTSEHRDDILPWDTLKEDHSDGIHKIIAEGQDARLVLSQKPFGFSFECSKTGSRIEHRGPVTAEVFHTPDKRRLVSINLNMTSPDGENFYGFGERYNRLNQRGQILSNRVFEQYKNQKLKTYMPVPFFFTNTHWGLLIQTDRTIDFDLAAHEKNRLHIEAETDNQISMVFLTGTPGEILKGYYHFEGSPELPPDWVFGPWMSGNEWNSQARVAQVVQKTRELDIPAEVLVIEAWSDEATFYQWNDSQAAPRPADQPPKLSDYRFPPDGLWPDPKGLADELHSLNMRLVLWQIPVVKHMGELLPELQEPGDSRTTPDPLDSQDIQGSQVFREPADANATTDTKATTDPNATTDSNATTDTQEPRHSQISRDIDLRQHQLDREYVAQQNLVFTEADGSRYAVRPGWFRSSFLPDFSQEQTRTWWFNKRRYLLEEVGVDGFKTDGGEHLWGYEVAAPSGGFGDSKINRFPKEYLDSYTDFIKNTPSTGEGRVLFSRAGYRGAHKTPMHWSGDQDSTWDAYRGTIRAMLNANLSGISFIGWDIGGFTGPVPTPELYLRSAAAAVFSPLMQYHSEYNHHRVPIVDRTPWNIGEFWGDSNVIPEYRFLAHLRMALKPYLAQEARWAVHHKAPLMQPLFFRWPGDEAAWQIEDSYLFGRFLLVAPLLEEGQTQRTVYLPEGEWSDFWTGEGFSGPCTIQATTTRSRIPVYVYETGRLQGFQGSEALQGSERLQASQSALGSAGSPEGSIGSADSLAGDSPIIPNFRLAAAVKK